MDLAEEKRHLKIMFVCFELSFVSQSIFLWVNAEWLDAETEASITYMCLNLLLPVLLDGTSIFVIIMLHRYAYSPHQIQARGSAAINSPLDDAFIEPSASTSQTSLNADTDDLNITAHFSGGNKEAFDFPAN